MKPTREEVLHAIGGWVVEPLDLAKHMGCTMQTEEPTQEWREAIWEMLADGDLELTWDRKLKRKRS